MHPLAAIGLVFFSGLAWLGTILTLLVSLAKARRRPPPVFKRERQGAHAGSPDAKAARPL